MLAPVTALAQTGSRLTEGGQAMMQEMQRMYGQGQGQMPGQQFGQAPNNRDPLPNEVEACKKYLDGHEGTVYFSVGTLAAAALLGPEADPVAAEPSLHLVLERDERDQVQGAPEGAVHHRVDARIAHGAVAEEAVQEGDREATATGGDEARPQLATATEYAVSRETYRGLRYRVGDDGRGDGDDKAGGRGSGQERLGHGTLSLRKRSRR